MYIYVLRYDNKHTEDLLFTRTVKQLYIKNLCYINIYIYLYINVNKTESSNIGVEISI